MTADSQGEPVQIGWIFQSVERGPEEWRGRDGHEIGVMPLEFIDGKD